MFVSTPLSMAGLDAGAQTLSGSFPHLSMTGHDPDTQTSGGDSGAADRLGHRLRAGD